MQRNGKVCVSIDLFSGYDEHIFAEINRGFRHNSRCCFSSLLPVSHENNSNTVCAPIGVFESQFDSINRFTYINSLNYYGPSISVEGMVQNLENMIKVGQINNVKTAVNSLGENYSSATKNFIVTRLMPILGNYGYWKVCIDLLKALDDLNIPPDRYAYCAAITVLIRYVMDMYFHSFFFFFFFFFEIGIRNLTKLLSYFL